MITVPTGGGATLRVESPGARLLELDGVGHRLPPPTTWDALVDAVAT